MPGMSFDRWPKAELHLHLEGTLGPETLWALAQRHHVSLPVASLSELRRLYEFESFERFIDLWMLMCSCLRAPEDYERMVDAFVAECARQRVRYVEAHFTPFNHERMAIGGRRALDVVTRRLQQAEAAGGPLVRLIADIPTNLDGAGAWTAELLEQEVNPLVVAIGLGGPERGWPRAAQAPWFERARRAGYDAVAHAGETDGADQVRQAVLELRVRRVQHGVRAVEDPAVLSLLAERGVCCDVALSSNECLKVVPNVAAHPLRQLLAAGVPVTLSTDDPPFFATDLNREYERAHLELGLTTAELWQINLNGLRHALVDTPMRRRLLSEFEHQGRALGVTPPSGSRDKGAS